MYNHNNSKLSNWIQFYEQLFPQQNWNKILTWDLHVMVGVELHQNLGHHAKNWLRFLFHLLWDLPIDDIYDMAQKDFEIYISLDESYIFGEKIVLEARLLKPPFSKQIQILPYINIVLFLIYFILFFVTVKIKCLVIKTPDNQPFREVSIRYHPAIR